MVAADKGVVIAASWYGKAKTVTQIIAIVLFIVKDSIIPVSPGDELANPLYVLSWAVMVVALALTIISMLDYFAKARHLLGFGVEQAAVDASDESSPALCGVPSDADLNVHAQRVVDKAVEKGLTLATAESLTGGLIAGALTAIPGSSAVVKGGVVSYVNEVKRNVLGVCEKDLDEFGAVSEQVACQMASGARQTLGSDIAVAVTGIAGPSGAEPGKPVGTVWIGLATSSSSAAHVFHFEGSRSDVRRSTVAQALVFFEQELTRC